MQPLAELEQTMRSLIDTENELRFHEQALNELHQKIARGEPVVSHCVWPSIICKPKLDSRPMQLNSTKTA